MKVLFICPTSSIYGDNIALLNIIPHLENKGVQPIFYTLRGDFCTLIHKLKYPYLTGYDVYCPGIWPSKRNIRFIGRILFKLISGVFFKEYKRLLKDVQEIGIDIIHSNSSTTALGYQLSVDLRIHHIWHVREYGSLDHGYCHFPTKLQFEKKINGDNTYSVFITESIRRFFNTPPKSMTIYDGVVKEDSSIALFETKDPYFLYVGRLEKTKGVHLAIMAFAEFCKYNSNFRLLIVGTGDIQYTLKLKKLTECYQITNNVVFKGYQKNVYQYMQHAQAIIVPSRYEAFGLITAEALYCGCPVIGHNTAGTKEQMDNVSHLNNKEGKIVYPYDNESQIVERMKEIVNCPLSLKQLKLTQDRIVSLYSTKKSAESIYNLYIKVMQSQDDN